MSGLSINTLRKGAQQSTKARGHRMAWAKPSECAWLGDPLGRWTQSGECRDCGMGVTLRTHPYPNEIDIGGEAVALNCKGRAWN